MYPIPANATRIRYLESTGTQYVDTGVAVSDPSTIAIEADEDVTQPFGFTHQNVASGTWVTRYSPPSAAGNIYIYYKNYSNRVVTTVNETRKVARWDGSSGYYENGTSVASFVASVGSDSIAGRNWLYGAVWDFNVNAVDSRSSRAGKIYGLKVEVSGTLVRSFVPVRVGQTGYLFDRVSGQLLGNAGTGDFVLGPDTFQQGVVPTRMMVGGVRKKPYDAEVDYIESTGTQYVDTLVNADNTTVLTMDGLFPAATDQYPVIFGLVDNTVSPTVRFNMGKRDNNGLRAFLDTSTLFLGLSYTFGNRKTFELDAVTAAARVGTSVATRTSFAWASNLPIYLFARNGVGTADCFAKLRVYGVTITKGSVLVRDYQPVRVGTRAELYDRVNKTFAKRYGSFVLGPDK